MHERHGLFLRSWVLHQAWPRQQWSPQTTAPIILRLVGACWPRTKDQASATGRVSSRTTTARPTRAPTSTCRPITTLHPIYPPPGRIGEPTQIHLPRRRRLIWFVRSFRPPADIRIRQPWGRFTITPLASQSQAMASETPARHSAFLSTSARALAPWPIQP